MKCSNDIADGPGAGGWASRCAVYCFGALMLATAVLFALLLLTHLFRMGIDPFAYWTISSGVAVIYLAMMLGAVVVVHVRGLLWLMALGTIAMMTALAFWIVLIWELPNDWETKDNLSIAASMLTLFSATALHSGAMACLKPRTVSLNGLRVLTIVLAWGFTGTVLIAAGLDFAFDIEPWQGVFYLMMFTGVGALTLTLVTPMVIRNDRRRWERARESVAERIKLEMGCPKCGDLQEVAVGTGRCRACGAIVTVELEEPRCECGYLLYRLTSLTCPECGREIPEDRRWPRE